MMNHGMSIKDGALCITLPDGAEIERVEVNGKTYTLPSRDLIDREEAIEEMAGAIWLYPNELYPTLRHYQNAKELAEYGLKDVPSAEPEIVRCGDCKWKQGSECVRFAEVRPFPDDFCSRAERRTDE